MTEAAKQESEVAFVDPSECVVDLCNALLEPFVEVPGETQGPGKRTHSDSRRIHNGRHPSARWGAPADVFDGNAAPGLGSIPDQRDQLPPEPSMPVIRSQKVATALILTFTLAVASAAGVLVALI